MHAVLERNGMVQSRRKRRYRAEGTELSEGVSPNELWCADYKGEFQLGDRRYCYLLAIAAAAMRTDNGVPFSSPTALFGLSRLSVWWLRLGVAIERIKPGNPQQNGRHERMHLTLKREATKPAAFNMLQEQSRFDEFIEQYNNDHPHQALDMKYPAELYTPSARIYAAQATPSTRSTIARSA